MNNLIVNLVMFIVVFIFIFLLQYNFFIKEKPKKKKKNSDGKVDEKKIIELEYISSKFNIEKSWLKTSNFGTSVCYINAFIISFTSTIVSNIPLAYYFQLMIGFVILTGLIYSLYELFGRSLLKAYEKDEKIKEKLLALEAEELKKNKTEKKKKTSKEIKKKEIKK